MEYNNDFKYDLKVGQVKEKELAEILNNKKIEVKKCTDAIYNVFVEYESRGAPSGISTTQADYWAFVLEYETVVIIPSNRLKQKCRTAFKEGRTASGGDSDTSKGVLLPVTELTN